MAISIGPESSLAMKDLLTTVLAVTIPVITAFLAYRNYLQQREHQLVRERYLDNGLDLLIGELEQALSVFRHNWSLAISLLKRFHEVGYGLDEKALKGFLSVNQAGMSITAVHRLRVLLNDTIAWDDVQNTYAFVTNANSFFCHDLAVTICTVTSGNVKLSIPKEEMVKRYTAEVTRLDTENHRHYQFLSRLLDVATILEREKFTFRSVAAFHARPDVRAIVYAMRSDAKAESAIKRGQVSV